MASNRRTVKHRRDFLKALAVGGGSVLGCQLVSAAGGQAPSAPANVRVDGKQVLSAGDFTYLGKYVLWGAGTYNYGGGLALRYVEGRPRLLVFNHDNSWQPVKRLQEFAIPSAFGTLLNDWPVSHAARAWPDIWSGRQYPGSWERMSDMQHMGMFWDEERQLLWTAGAIDYPQTEAEKQFTQSLMVRTLNDNGTVSNVRGVWGLAGRTHRVIYGGVVKVPGWFQAKYGTGPYAAGFGGYASLANQCVSPVALGLALYAIPAPENMVENEVLSTGRYRTLAEVGASGSSADWYGQGSPDYRERGVTGPSVLRAGGNFLDMGNWQSPAPDGLGRWTWPASHHQACVWIDGQLKHGFVAIPTLPAGDTWYNTHPTSPEGRAGGTNQPYSDRRVFEFQIYDPEHFGEVALGTRPKWAVKPTHRWDATPIFSEFGSGYAGNGIPGSMAAAVFDPLARRLYVHGVWGANISNYIYVFEVAC